MSQRAAKTAEASPDLRVLRRFGAQSISSRSLVGFNQAEGTD